MTQDGVTGIATAALLAGAAGAGLLLRSAWSDRTARRPWLIAAGWLVVAVLLTLPGVVLGSGRGPFVAMMAISVAVLAVVVRGVEVRQSKSRGDKSLAPEPSERASKAWRGWLRALLAGPLGMIAAMGVAISWSVWAPGPPQTRLLIGGIMVPVLWGAAMAWTLADDRILRATAVLTGVTVVTFTAAVLKGFS